MKGELNQIIEDGIKIVFIDEAIFSPQALMKRCWSRKNENIEVADVRRYGTTYALVAGISNEQGQEASLIERRSIHQDSFIKFLLILRANNRLAEIAVFMDHLSVHKANRVKEEMKKLNLRPIFGIPYTP